MSSDPNASVKRHEVADELRPFINRSEADGINRIGECLKREVPAPSAAFRAQLRAALGQPPRTRPKWRPTRLRLLAAAYSISGAILVAVAGFGVAGVGPFAT
jgi:hypothetical protein